jgi:tetratricopeptide (TPR) repeat protein
MFAFMESPMFALNLTVAIACALLSLDSCFIEDKGYPPWYGLAQQDHYVDYRAYYYVSSYRWYYQANSKYQSLISELDGLIKDKSLSSKMKSILLETKGDIFIGNGDYKNAGDCYREAFESDGTNREALNKIALIIPSSMESTIATYREIGDTSPMKSLLASRIGGIYFEKGDYETASKYFHDALRFDANSASSLYYLSIIMKSSGQYDSTVSFINRCVDISLLPVSGVANALIFKGSILIAHGRYIEAEICLKYALYIQPNSEHGIVLYAHVLIINDKVALALHILKDLYDKMLKTSNTQNDDFCRCTDLLIRSKIIFGLVDEARTIFGSAKARGSHWVNMEFLDIYLELASNHDKEALSKLSSKPFLDKARRRRAACIKAIILSTSNSGDVKDLKSAVSCLSEYSNSELYADICVLYAKIIILIQSNEYDKAGMLLKIFKSYYGNRFPRHNKECFIIESMIKDRVKFNSNVTRQFLLLFLD